MTQETYKNKRLENIEENYILKVNAPHNDMLGFICDVVDEVISAQPNATREQACFSVARLTLKLLRPRLNTTPKEEQRIAEIEEQQKELEELSKQYGEKVAWVIISNTKITYHNKNQKWANSFTKARQGIGEELYNAIVYRAVNGLEAQGRVYA